MTKNTTKKFDVYVTPLYEGNLSAKDEMNFKSQATITQIRSVIKQLLDGLYQLHTCGKSHNDIKPNNILYRFLTDDDCDEELMQDDELNVEIKISDFGQCDQSGGTPGWTYPSFLNDDTFNGDMYSMGLVCLYLLTEDPEIFYSLRDNYIENTKMPWIKRFRQLPEIRFVIKMISRSNQLSIAECLREWKRIETDVDLITESRLAELQVPQKLLKLQFTMSKTPNSSRSLSHGQVTAREK